jgi:hypothetical protein
MKATLSSMYNELSGKFGGSNGVVNFNWRNIQVLRQMVIPRNPRSSNQILIRAIMTQCAQGFQDISTANKAAWAAYCASNPVTIMGKSVQLPEIAMFVRINSWALIDGGSISDTPPATLSDFAASAIGTRAFVSSTHTLSFIVTHNSGAAAGELWLIRVTGKLPSAVKKPQAGDYRLIKGVNANSIISVSASPQTVSIATPTFENYVNGESMGIQLLPLSSDYDEGTVFETVGAVTVT